MKRCRGNHFDSAAKGPPAAGVAVAAAPTGLTALLGSISSTGHFLACARASSCVREGIQLVIMTLPARMMFPNGWRLAIGRHVMPSGPTWGISQSARQGPMSSARLSLFVAGAPGRRLRRGLERDRKRGHWGVCDNSTFFSGLTLATTSYFSFRQNPQVSRNSAASCRQILFAVHGAVEIVRVAVAQVKLIH